MGSGTRHRKRFLQEHPLCIFCGGSIPATTIEHCPPRSLFQDREWPQGFEFPACQICNNGSSEEDLIIAMFGRMDPFENKGNIDGRHIGMMRNVHKQFPNLISSMMPSATEARKSNRLHGITPPPGLTHREAGLVNIPKEFHSAMRTFAKKLAKGIFYKETGKTFPNEGCLLLNWFTNVDLLKTGKYPVFEVLDGLTGNAPPLIRSNKLLNDQFEFKLSIDPEHTIFIIQAKFGNSFGLVILGCRIEGKLESFLEEISKAKGKEGPLQVIQSPTI